MNNLYIKIFKDFFRVPFITNYIKTTNYMDPAKAIYEYGVSFDPPVHEIDVRSKLLNQHQGKIGTLDTCDGETLYLPFLIENTVRFFKKNSYIFTQKITFSSSPIDF